VGVTTGITRVPAVPCRRRSPLRAVCRAGARRARLELAVGRHEQQGTRFGGGAPSRRCTRRRTELQRTTAQLRTEWRPRVRFLRGRVRPALNQVERVQDGSAVPREVQGDSIPVLRNGSREYLAEPEVGPAVITSPATSETAAQRFGFAPGAPPCSPNYGARHERESVSRVTHRDRGGLGVRNTLSCSRSS
jgi:hypothetical protein